MICADTDLLEMLRDSVADYCARALPRGRLRPLRGAEPAYERARWREMAELGWAALLIPPARGGLGLGADAAVIVCRQLGKVAAPEPMLETGLGAAAVLARVEAAGALVSELISGARTFSHPLPGADTDPFTQVAAVRAGAVFALDGVTASIPLGPDVDSIVLPAMLEDAPALFHLPLGGSGCELRIQNMADGSRDARAHLVRAHCAPADLLLVGAGARTAFEQAMALGALASAAYLLGMAEALLELTLDYVRSRRQFGQAIGSFQVIQHRLVDLYMHVRLTEAVVNESAATFATDTQAARRDSASRARYRACETALAAAREAVQLHGAFGYTDECDVALYLHRILVLVARYGNASEQVERLAGQAAEHAAAGLPQTRMETRDDAIEPPGGDWNAIGNDAFRGIVRNWVETHYPGELRHLPYQVRWADIAGWHRKLMQRGWAAPAWPVQHGGMGLASDKLLIFIEELERFGVARAPDQGIIMLGPILLQYGTAEQQARFLPGALSGEQIWCQGYSEPEAGSDLAALRTRAVAEGDEFVVTGQKTWTTHALDATHMFCLVRTDPAAKPQAGISFLLIDLAVPGVTIRPIRNLAGDEEFCEVFLEKVRVPATNLVGPLNQGWTIAKALLGFERLFVGSPKQCRHALEQLRALAAATGSIDSPVFRDRLVRLELDVSDLEHLYKQFADTVRRGQTLGADVAVLKIWATETYTRISEFMLTAAGDAGGVRGVHEFGGTPVDVLGQYYGARPAPIYAGSNEIQRNIVAKRVLALPER